MTRAVILSAVRTPIGRYGGGLAAVRPDDLAALVIAEAVARAGVRRPRRSRTSGSAARTRPARTTGTSRGSPRCWPVCPTPSPASPSTGSARSGLAAVVGACHAVVAGDGDLFVAGGVESMTPRTARDREARRAVRPRRPDALRHDPRLALRQPPLRGALLAGGDGRDRRERRRALGRLARGPGRVRAASQARWAAAAEAGRFADELVAAPAS